jgi:hypothetical protein
MRAAERPIFKVNRLSKVGDNCRDVLVQRTIETVTKARAALVETGG